MTAWTDHIKAFAKSKGISYKDALKNPESSATYKASKGGEIKTAVIVPKPQQNIEMVIEELPAKKGRGRPKKYTTDDEAKKAKTAKTMESNKRKKAEIINNIKENPPIVPKVPKKLTDDEVAKLKSPIKEVPKLKSPIKKTKGEGLNVGYSTENANGLAHIYPISHEAVLQMLSCCTSKV